MVDKKKIGLCIAYTKNHNNYGTALLGYATVKVVADLGYACEIIYYQKKQSFFEKVSIAPLQLISGGFRAFIRRFSKQMNLRRYPHYRKGIQDRTRAVNQYKYEKFEPLCRTYVGFDALSKGALNYDLVLVGSDQIWVPLGLYTKFFNLLFVADRIPKVAYASSFGVSKIPFWQVKQTKRYLERLDAIGVREMKGKEIVESVSTKQAKVVLDPTLLLTGDQWKQVADRSDVSIGEGYIFCYFLGTNPESRAAVRELAHKTGLKIVFMPHMDEYIPEDEGFADYALYSIAPPDFINLIRNAAYVCTDSFHGTVFSIQFKKQFVTFYRYAAASSNSRNSRIDSLFELLGLQERLYAGNICDQMIVPIPYEQVHQALAVLRDDSLQFLSFSLALSGSARPVEMEAVK